MANIKNLKVNNTTYGIDAHNADTATAASKFTSNKTINLTGAITGSVTTDFSSDTASITTSAASIPQGSLTWGGPNFTGVISPLGAALSEYHSANRLAFLNPDAILVEQSNDGGTNWTTSNMLDASKINLVTLNSSVTLGTTTPATTNHRARITITAQNGTTGYFYTQPRKLLINVSTSGHAMKVLIEVKIGASNASWETVGTYNLSGWSGWNDIPLTTVWTLGGGTTQTSNFWYMRLTFFTTSVNSDYSNSLSNIISLRLFGDTCWQKTSNLGETGHLYAWDSEQSAYFPKNVSADAYRGSGYYLTNLNASNIGSGTVPSDRLPAATTSAQGAVKVGSNITVSSGTISLSKTNVTSALGYTPPTSNTNYYHSTGSWNGLTYTATANGGAPTLQFTIPTGTTSTTVAAGNHTHSQYLTSHQDISGKANLSGAIFTGGVTITPGQMLSLNKLNVPTTVNGGLYGPGSSGQVLKSNGTTVYWGTDNNTNTTNTAGSTNTTSKIYLVGPTSQTTYAQTYSNSGCYASGGYLYSNGVKVDMSNVGIEWGSF